MCDRCAELDYPIADVWRPCYRSSHAEQMRAREKTRPVAYHDDYFETSQTITSLRAILHQQARLIRSQRRTIEALRLSNPSSHVASKPFEGPIGN